MKYKAVCRYEKLVPTYQTTLLKLSNEFVYILLLFFFSDTTVQRGPGPPHSLRFVDHTHNDTPKSVGLLWMRDRPIAETSA